MERANATQFIHELLELLVQQKGMHHLGGSR